MMLMFPASIKEEIFMNGKNTKEPSISAA